MCGRGRHGSQNNVHCSHSKNQLALQIEEETFLILKDLSTYFDFQSLIIFLLLLLARKIEPKGGDGQVGKGHSYGAVFDYKTCIIKKFWHKALIELYLASA